MPDMPPSAPTLPPGKLPGDMLARLISRYRTPTDESVVVNASYGFDAAAIATGTETILVKSDPITFATTDAAGYLVTVNANDIACMGGIPRWMTVVALLPEHGTTPELVESLFADLQKVCIAESISLIGGHTEITIGVDRPLLVGTLLGTIGEFGLLKPGNAAEGDELYVTKAVGMEGTALLASERQGALVSSVGETIVESAKALLDDPGISITYDAHIALGTGTITALHDPTEGGIATAIHELSEASALGARVNAESIPILKETAAICRCLGIDPLGLLSSGALLIATRPGSEDAIRRAYSGTDIAVTRIGSLTSSESGCTIVDKGELFPLPRYDSDELARILSS